MIDSSMKGYTCLKAGPIEPLSRNAEDWIFLDIGFAQQSTRSCGLAIFEERPIEVAWSDAVQIVLEHSSERAAPLHLMIEAPLSMAFCQYGSPIGRSFEPSSHVWYQRAGACVLLSSALLLSRLAKSSSSSILLFEAFVTNAGQREKQHSSHADDAATMRASMLENSQVRLLGASDLKKNRSDVLKSSMHEFGIDFGIPPVLVAGKEAMIGRST